MHPPHWSRATMLRQQVAEAMTEGTNTQAPVRTEYTEWVEQENFSDKTFLLTYDKEAVAKVPRVHMYEPQEIFMCIVSSKLESNQTGSSVM